MLTGACPLLGKFGGDWFLGVNSCTSLRAAGLCVLMVARLMFASLKRSGVGSSRMRLIALQIPMSVKMIARAQNVHATIRLGISYQLSDNADIIQLFSHFLPFRRCRGAECDLCQFLQIKTK